MEYFTYADGKMRTVKQFFSLDFIHYNSLGSLGALFKKYR